MADTDKLNIDSIIARLLEGKYCGHRLSLRPPPGVIFSLRTKSKKDSSSNPFLCMEMQVLYYVYFA